MKRIDGPGATVDNLFTSGDPVTAVPPTRVLDTWLNNVQEEICNVIIGAGNALNGALQNQLFTAIGQMISDAIASGFGTISTQDANNVTITGGSITGITDLAVADGGTGSSTASGAFTNLKQQATTTATGVVELATDAEVAAGSDAGRVSPVASMGFHSGVCKAWINFNGTGTIATRASYGISSIVDSGTGLYTLNFTNTLADVNYAVSGSCGTGSTSDKTMGFQVNNFATTSVRIHTWNASASADYANINIVVHGNQ